MKGAVESGLDENYINGLQLTKSYKPDNETLERRKTIPLPRSLTPYTVEKLFATKAQTLSELMDTETSFAFISMLGYVIRVPSNKIVYKSYIGRDLTSINLKRFRGQHFVSEDDMGKPPYPDVVNLSEDEKEYLYHHMDNYLDKGEIVGYLQEFQAENDVTKM